MWSGGAASSDWAWVGSEGELGVVPKGVSGVLARLCSLAPGVVAWLVVVVWQEIGTTGGEAGGVCWDSAGAEGPAPSVGAVVIGVGLAGGVGDKTTISRCERRRIKRRNFILFTFDSSQSLHSNSREKGVERNIYLFDIERVKLKKRVNTVHVRDQKHELTPPRNSSQLFCKDLPNVYSIASQNCVDQQQPCSVDSLVVRSGHKVTLDKRVPQLCFGQETEAVDRVGISALCVPFCVWFAQEILDHLIILPLEPTKHGIKAWFIVWQAEYGIDCCCCGWDPSASDY
ncbi:hypothetical protein GQ457_11G026670 [Hibiscus cannabinus]